MCEGNLYFQQTVILYNDINHVEWSMKKQVWSEYSISPPPKAAIIYILLHLHNELLKEAWR